MKLWRYGHAIESLGQRYRLQGHLGSGGMADVCLAWDEHEAREVAIKVIKSDQLDQRTLDRFIKEAAQVARWQHPNILHIYSDLKLELLNAAQGSIVPYIVMEYAQGGDLHKRLTPGQPYPFAATLDLFTQLCSAVAYAHEHGIIHRDLKPLNILFRQLPAGNEQVVLSDFGLAVEIDATHHTFAHGGTPLYMAPEQLRGRALPASDIFALGVIFYQLCTGRLPFRLDRSTPPILPSSIVPTLPPALDNIILKSLAPDPAQRFSTASDFWNAIQSVIYNNHLKPTHSIPQQDLSNPTNQNRQPASADLKSFSAQQVVVADSQKPLIPILDPMSQVSQAVQQPVSHVNNLSIGTFNNSYSRKIQANNIENNDTNNLDEASISNRPAPCSRLDSVSPITRRSSGKRSFSLQSRRSRILILSLIALLCVGGLLASLSHIFPSLVALNSQHNSTLVHNSTPAHNSTTAAAISVAQDNFQRQDQVLWGTASDSNIWGGDANNPNDQNIFSIVNQSGQIANGPGTFNALLGPATSDADVTISAQINAFTGNTNLGVLLRWQDANNWYKALIDGTQLRLVRNFQGTTDTLGSVPFNAQGGRLYNLRFRALGAMLLAKVWLAGTQQPTAWMIVTSDSSLHTGQSGIRVVILGDTIVTVKSFQDTRVNNNIG